MKVLFVRPNKDAFGYKPVGISLLSGIVKREGHDVRLFDTTFYDLGFAEHSAVGTRINKFKPVDWTPYNVGKVKCDLKAEFMAVLGEFAPDVCAFSFLSDERFVARELAGYVKEFRKDVPVIWGGIHPTIASEESINVEHVDYVCMGEGIEALPELLRALEEGRDTTDIKNIQAKLKGKIYRNEARPMFQEMDSLPFVDWEIYDRRQFFKPFDGNVVVGGDWMSNWGCPYRCTYCINFWLNTLSKRTIRRYSPERAVRELKHLKEKYGLTFMRFHDEDFLMRPIEHLREFGKLYAAEVALPFSIETNPRSVTPEKVEILKSMGIASASVAIESGNAEMRRNVLKRVDSLDDVVRAFGLFREAGIRTASFNMMGLPYETREKVFDTIEINRRAGPTVSDCGFFFPFEATELYEISVREGFYKKEEVPVYRRDYPALDQPGLSREELLGLYKCFTLYVKLPKSFWPLIRRAERDDPVGQEIYEILSDIYNKHVFHKGDYFSE